jgi:streptogramin lyase
MMRSRSRGASAKSRRDSGDACDRTVDVSLFGRVLACALALAGAAVLAAGSSGGRSQEESIRVGGAPLQLLAARGSLWVLTCDRRCRGEARFSVGSVIRIDPRTGHVTASAEVDRPQAIAVGAGVFGLDFWRGYVYRLDPKSLRVTGRLRLVLPWSIVDHDNAFLPETITLGEGSVWVTTNRGAVARIDARSLRLVRIVRLEPAALDAVAAGGGAAWVALELDGVARLDPSTYRLTARANIRKGDRALSVSQTLLGDGKVLAIGNWTEGHTATNTNAFARINPSSVRVEGVTLLPGPRLALTLGGGSLWAARAGGKLVERIRPHHRKRRGTGQGCGWRRSGSRGRIPLDCLPDRRGESRCGRAIATCARRGSRDETCASSRE